MRERRWEGGTDRLIKGEMRKRRRRGLKAEWGKKISAGFAGPVQDVDNILKTFLTNTSTVGRLNEVGGWSLTTRMGKG